MSQKHTFTTLALLDNIQFPKLENGKPLALNYSHDKNLFQFVHEALRRGHTVFLASAQEPTDPKFRVKVVSAYPNYVCETADINNKDVDFVVSVFPDALNIKPTFPNAKIIAIMPALHWVEDPGLFTHDYLRRVITAARYHVDYYVTQNIRMKQVLFSLLHLLARFPYEDRILVAPQGIVDEVKRQAPDRQELRQKLGLEPDDIMVLNSGGIWKWTDFNTFFQAFCEFTVENPSHRLRLYMMGIVQPFNRDHDEYVAQFRAILDKYRDKLGKHLVLFEDWDEGGKHVQDYLSIADVGINVSQDTLEAWQSYRMRFLDYMYFGIPVINTSGDDFSTRHPDALFVCKPKDTESYKTIFRQITDRPELVSEKSAMMREIAAEYDSQQTYGRLIEKLERLPARPEKDHVMWDASIADQPDFSATPTLHHAQERHKNWFVRTWRRLTQSRKRNRMRMRHMLAGQSYLIERQAVAVDQLSKIDMQQKEIADALDRLNSAVNQKDAPTQQK